MDRENMKEVKEMMARQANEISALRKTIQEQQKIMLEMKAMLGEITTQPKEKKTDRPCLCVEKKVEVVEPAESSNELLTNKSKKEWTFPQSQNPLAIMQRRNGTQVAVAGTEYTFCLCNATAQRIVFNISTSNDNEYRVEPPYGFVIPGGLIDFAITRLPGAAEGDKMFVQYAVSPSNSDDAVAEFAAASHAAQLVVEIPL